jgi:hypothetical protein
LSKAQQERFRSLMWEFRRDPKDLKPEQREGLDRLFAEVPVLKDVYDVRVRFKEIFDTAPDRATAEEQLAELRARTESLGLDFGKFWTTYDNWKEGILNYFDERYTSAAVEGINNKARVITKRCYGVKSSGTLWNRLILDLNRASEAVGRTIGELREITWCPAAVARLTAGCSTKARIVRQVTEITYGDWRFERCVPRLVLRSVRHCGFQ